MPTPNTETQVAQSETPQISDDLPYRIVEEMGLGLTFRSCTCGQLPCARLRPIRDALEAVRRNERERCAKLAELMATGETYGTGRQKAINIAATIRGD